MKRAGWSGRTLRFLLIFLLLGPGVYALDDLSTGNSVVRGDSAAAERYAQWAKNAMEQGRWKDALAALERASDFADVSSDISYLLALARSHENKARGTVLGALDAALGVDRWKMCDPESARLLRAETLIALRAYPEALAELSRAGKSPGEAVLRLKALVSFRPAEFRSFMTETLDRYPRETGPVRFFFSFIKNENEAGSSPGKDDVELLELVIRRLPVLLLKDPELAWMAAPFVRDIADAKRLVQAYRAVNNPVIASLPIALRLGIIDEETALEELFGGPGETRIAAPNAGAGAVLDISLLGEIWELLRTEEARTLFRRNLSAFTGVITEDRDKDGIPEISVEYDRGRPALYSFDAVQNGVPDMTVYFEAGNPRRAMALVPPEASGAAGPLRSFMNEGNRKWAEIRWEQYPAVLETELDGVRFIPRPFEFHFSPLKFGNLWGSDLVFPQRDPLSPPLTRRVLVINALRVERPSLEFNGGIEVVELSQGIPMRAREYVGDLMVSETEFLRGRPQLQRVDLDFDGRVDTARWFRKVYRQMELEELWDYDRDIIKTETVSDWEFE